MFASQLIKTGFPVINLFDKASLALALMEEYDVVHLPVISEEKYAGIISKDDLLDIDESTQLTALAAHLLPLCIKGEEHFLLALKMIADNELSLLPVISDQQELAGVIAVNDILSAISRFVGNESKGGVIVLETDKKNFSFGEISRLVETNDAYITQLNTYTEGDDAGILVITLKVNKIEISDIIATFQRYEYTVRYFFGEEDYTNELKENYQHLISYLNM
jgi:CBS domain-containing protein